MKPALATFLVLVFVFGSVPVLSGERPIVAVFDIEDTTATFNREVLYNLTEYLSVKLAEGGYQVMPRDQVRDRLVREKRGSYQECFDKSCQIEMGRELAAQKILSVRILKVAGRCQLAATLYDLKKAATDGAASSEGSCNEKSMGQAVLIVSAKLSGKPGSDFEDYLTAAKKKLDERQRAGEAWKVIRAIAEDPTEPLESRIAGLEKFVEEFGERNPYRAEALDLLEGISVGTLIVSTEPESARVIIDSSELGVAPVSQEVRAGEHRVLASHHGFRNGERLVKVKPGSEVRLLLKLSRLEPARLSIRTQPEGATIRIDSSEAGVTPLSMELEGGEYRLEASLAGHASANKTVLLMPGQTAEVSMELTRLGMLKVVSDPPGSRVIIEGKEVGTAPFDMQLQPGEYSVTLAAEDHFTRDDRIEVRSGKTTEVKLRLEAVPPYTLWGHIAFWSGLGLAAFGSVSGILASSAGDDYKAGDREAYDSSVAWAGCMYTGLAAGGALIVTGVVLWALAPSENEFSGKTSFTALPSSEGGIVFSLGGRF